MIISCFFPFGIFDEEAIRVSKLIRWNLEYHFLFVEFIFLFKDEGYNKTSLGDKGDSCPM